MINNNKINELFTKVEEETEEGRAWKNKGVKLDGSTIVPHFTEPIRISEGGYNGSIKSYIDQSNIKYIDGRNLILDSGVVSTNYEVSFGAFSYLGKRMILTLFKDDYLSFNKDFSDFTNGINGVTNNHSYFAGDTEFRKIRSTEESPKELKYSFPKDNYSFSFQISNLIDSEMIIRFNNNSATDIVFPAYKTDYVNVSGNYSSISFITTSLFHFDFSDVKIGTPNEQTITFKSGNDINYTVDLPDIYNSREVPYFVTLPADMELPISMSYLTKEIAFNKVKLEVGSNFTEWIPAPEDINPGFSDYQEYITHLDHEIVRNEREYKEHFVRTEETISGIDGVLDKHLETYSNFIRSNADLHERTLKKVNADGTVLQSIVTQKADGYAISADAIDLTGLTTFSDLKGTGKTTVISGDNITTGKVQTKYVNFDGAKGINMDLTGKVTATSGAIAGWTISGSQLMSSDTRTGMHSGIYATDPAFWAGGTNPWTTSGWTDKTPFYVTNAGKLYATGADISGKITAGSGLVGGWTIGDNIYSKNGSTFTTLKSGGNVAFAAGSSSSADTSGAPFQIFHSGKLYAKNAEIEGKITATSGSFSAGLMTGTLHADRIAGGSITGAKIAGGAITAAKIAGGTITAAKIASNTITAAEMAYIGGYTFHTNYMQGNSVTLSSSSITVGPATFSSGVYGSNVSALLITGTDDTVLSGQLTVSRLQVTGSKNAVVPTRDGIRAIHAYETAVAYFGDIEEVFVENSLEIIIDELFGDTIHLEDYQVFTTAYGDGNVWVEDRNEKSFLIKTSKPMRVGYEIKGVRRGYREERLPVSEMTYDDYAKAINVTEEEPIIYTPDEPVIKKETN